MLFILQISFFSSYFYLFVRYFIIHFYLSIYFIIIYYFYLFMNLFDFLKSFGLYVLFLWMNRFQNHINFCRLFWIRRTSFKYWCFVIVLLKFVLTVKRGKQVSKKIYFSCFFYLAVLFFLLKMSEVIIVDGPKCDSYNWCIAWLW